MDAGLRRLTQVEGLLPARLEAVPSPKPAPFDVLRLCSSERDAVLVSIRLSRLSQREIAARIGVTPQALSKWKQDGVPGDRTRAFCNATGTTLLAQYHALHNAMRESAGQSREADRIARIAALAEAA